MALLRCKTCGGEYETTNADGSPYFHRCPPLSIEELITAYKAGTLQLRPALQYKLQRAATADLADPKRPGSIGRVEMLLQGVIIERPNLRDETPVRSTKPGPRYVPTAEGAGVDELAGD